MKTMTVALTVAMAALAVAGCSGTTGTKESTTAPVAPVYAFAPPTTPAQAPDGFGTEPSLLVAHDGAIYFTSVLGSATARGDGLWKTTDNGTSWTYLGKADYPFGGGDSDIDELASGRLLLTGQWRPAALPVYVTGGESVSYSTDGGKTWTPSPAAGYFPGADRNWLATAPDGTAYLVFNDAATGLMVGKSTDGGVTWLPPSTVAGSGSVDGAPIAAGGPNGIAGDAVVDSHGTLFIPYGPGPGGGTVQRVLSSSDGMSFTTHVVRTTPSGESSGAIFSTLALDSAGNLYYAWAETKDKAMHVLVSISTDQAKTWQTPDDLTPPGMSIAFPWVVAAGPGQYAVAYYATNGSHLPDDAPAEALWHPWVTFVGDPLHPTPVRAAEAPNHKGPICTGGTGCTSGRTLGDFFEMGLDKWGRVAIVYADDTGTAQSNHVVVQTRGSLLG